MKLLTAKREGARKRIEKKTKEDLIAKDTPTHMFGSDINGQFIRFSRLSVVKKCCSALGFSMHLMQKGYFVSSFQKLENRYP